MQIKKKTAAVAAAAAIGSVAVGGAAWAYIVATGDGTGSATTSNATAGNVTLTGSANIADLETPADVTIKGTSTVKNRRINNVIVTINQSAVLPNGCQPTWFKVSGGDTFGNMATVAVNHTFTSITEETVLTPGLTVKLVDNPDFNQKGCVSGASLNGLLTLTTS